MRQTMRITVLLLLAVLTAGQAWALRGAYSITKGTISGGEIGFYASTDESATLIDQAAAGSTVYIATAADGRHSSLGVAFTVTKSGPSSQAESRRRSPQVATIEVSAVEGKPGMYSFTMPAEGSNVVVSAEFPDKEQTTGVEYLDATGSGQTHDAYILDGTERYLGVAGEDTWYVANGPLAYYMYIYLHGVVHLILADGAQMTVTTPSTVDPIWGATGSDPNSLSIYAQSTGNNMGSLSVTSKDANGKVAAFGIYAGNITINGGRVSANGKFALRAGGYDSASGNVTINGGIVTARTFGDGGYAIEAGKKVIINGGQVKAVLNDGTDEEPYKIYAAGGIALGWTTADDYILAGSYELGTGEGIAVTVASGKGFIAYLPADGTYPEREAVLIAGKGGGRTLDAQCLAAIGGKTLRPATSEAASVDYTDWDATAKAPVSRNTATDTNEANDIVYLLTGGGATVLPGSWYVAKGEVTYNGQLKFTGDTHLILADGAEMTVGTTESPINAHAIWGHPNYGNDYSLTIYGQGGKTEGKLTAVSSFDNGIYADPENGSASVTINGGQVTATSTSSNGIYAYSSTSSSITINGGQVTAIGSNSNGIYANSNGGTATVSINGGKVNAEGKDFGIETYNDITISGGKVTATGRTGYTAGFASRNGNIHLGWTNADDYIYATGYINGGDNKVYVDATAGQRFVAWTPATTEGGAETASSIVGSGLVSDRTTVNGKMLRPLAVAETGTDGKVTTYPGYVVTTPAGLTMSGKTDQGGAPEPDFTITTDEGGTAVTTPYYIYKAGAGVGITTNDYLHTGVEISGTNVPADIAVSDDRKQATFQMPAEDVAVTGMKFYATGVKYMDWDETTKALKPAVAPKAYILTGGGLTTLDGGWYVVTNWNTAADGDGHSPDAAYTSQLQFNGATHLILADGAEMSVDILDSDTQGTGYGYAIFVKNSDLATLDIYGQALGTGALTAKSARFHAIYLRSNNSGSKSNLTINGGKVSATCSTSNDGIYVCGGVNCTASVIINGGELAASGKYAINAYSGNASVTITGGQVEASGNSIGIWSNGDITLSLTKSGEYIKANSYYAYGSVKIPAGKALACTIGETTSVMGSTDATNYVFGAAGNATLEFITGQTLVYATTVPLGSGTDQYAAYCSTDGDYRLTDGVKPYAVTSIDLATKSVTLSESPLEGLADDVPLILMMDRNGDGEPDGTLGSSLTLVGTTASEASTIESSVPADISPMFIAGDGTSTVADLMSKATGTTAAATDYMVFTLTGGKFRAVTFTATTVPAKGACFLIVSKTDVLLMLNGSTNPPAAGARERGIPFALGGDATGIETPPLTPSLEGAGSGCAEWYDLQGRRLSGQPTQKGVYVRDGSKVVVK